MQQITINDDTPILVELYSQPGMQMVSLSPEDLVKKSEKALDSAMSTIYGMAHRICATVESLVEKPTHLEVEFGLKLNGESGALIAKAGIEANLKVKLIWDRRSSDSDKPSPAPKSS